VQLTYFGSEPAFVVACAWSRVGKKFALTRARSNDTDIVMFSGFREEGSTDIIVVASSPCAP